MVPQPHLATLPGSQFPAQELPGSLAGAGRLRPTLSRRPLPCGPATLGAQLSLLACRASGSPPLAGDAPTFTCLELAQLGARRGKTPPARPTPASQPGLQGWGGKRVLGWHLLWQQRVKANLPGLALGLAGGLPTPQMGWKTRPLAIPTLALLRTLENSCSLVFGEPFQPSLSCQGPPGHCGHPLSVRHSWTHPVSSTLSPHTVFVQSAPFYICNPTHILCSSSPHPQRWPEL